MPTAISSKGIDRHRAWAVLVGYNLPAVLWLGYAFLRPWLAPTGLWCPMHSLLGWCPGCGTTTALSAWIHDGALPAWPTLLLVAGFGLNALWSLYRAVHRPCRS